MVHAADALDLAKATGAPTAPPGLDDVAIAYRVQAAFVSRTSRRQQTNGAGYKIAFTSEAAQRSVKTTTPASGRLLKTDLVRSGSTLPRGRLIAPLVEAELLFRPRRDLALSASAAEIMEGCDVAAGLELPDGRYQGWFGGEFPVLTKSDVIADNCLVGAVVFGDVWVSALDAAIESLVVELSWGTRTCRRGGAGEVLGNPKHAMSWLAGHLATSGVALRAGEVVSAGTFTPPLRAGHGVLRANFGDALGDVVVRLS